MSFFRLLAQSFWSADLYARLRRQRRYYFGYSFFLVALTSLVTLGNAAFVIDRGLLQPQGDQPPVFDQAVEQIARQWPEMTLHDGALSTREAKISRIALNLTAFGFHIDEDLLTIDTTGATTPATMKTPMLLTANDFVTVNNKERRLRAVKDMFDEPRTLVINRAMINETASHAKDWVHAHATIFYGLLVGLGWCVLTPMMYIARIATLLVFAAGLAVVGSSMNRSFPFASAFGMATIAFTPVALADFVAGLISHSVPPWLLLLCGAVMAGAAFAASHEEPVAPAA